MRKILAALPLGLVSLVGLAIVHHADSQPLGSVEPGSGAKPQLSLQFVALYSRTGQGGPSTEINFTFSRVGESATIYVWTGGPDMRTLCAPGSGSNEPANSAVTWRADAKLVSYDASGATFDVHWSRLVREAALSDGPSMDRNIRVRLGERQRQVLDLLRLPMRSELDDDCDGAAITMELTFTEAESVANSLLEYDVWLVDRDRGGHETIDHVTPRGLQGRSIDYAFRPLQYGANGIASKSGNMSVELHVTVKGRARPDGRIDLVVGAMRTVWNNGLGAGDGGAKQATIADGETIEFELPQLTGDLREVHLPELLAGHRTVVLVKARRLS